ncbi:hypothetical protein BDK51DRAFT_30025, partial [Blyttiomyces helicus]
MFGADCVFRPSRLVLLPCRLRTAVDLIFLDRKADTQNPTKMPQSIDAPAAPHLLHNFGLLIDSLVHIRACLEWVCKMLRCKRHGIERREKLLAKKRMKNLGHLRMQLDRLPLAASSHCLERREFAPSHPNASRHHLPIQFFELVGVSHLNRVLICPASRLPVGTMRSDGSLPPLLCSLFSGGGEEEGEREGKGRREQLSGRWQLELPFERKMSAWHVLSIKNVKTLLRTAISRVSHSDQCKGPSGIKGKRDRVRTPTLPLVPCFSLSSKQNLQIMSKSPSFTGRRTSSPTPLHTGILINRLEEIQIPQPTPRRTAGGSPSTGGARGRTESGGDSTDGSVVGTPTWAARRRMLKVEPVDWGSSSGMGRDWDEDGSGDTFSSRSPGILRAISTADVPETSSIHHRDDAGPSSPRVAQLSPRTDEQLERPFSLPNISSDYRSSRIFPSSQHLRSEGAEGSSATVSYSSQPKLLGGSGKGSVTFDSTAERGNWHRFKYAYHTRQSCTDSMQTHANLARPTISSSISDAVSMKRGSRVLIRTSHSRFLVGSIRTKTELAYSPAQTASGSRSTGADSNSPFIGLSCRFRGLGSNIQLSSCDALILPASTSTRSFRMGEPVIARIVDEDYAQARVLGVYRGMVLVQFWGGGVNVIAFDDVLRDVAEPSAKLVPINLPERKATRMAVIVAVGSAVEIALASPADYTQVDDQVVHIIQPICAAITALFALKSLHISFAVPQEFNEATQWLLTLKSATVCFLDFYSLVTPSATRSTLVITGVALRLGQITYILLHPRMMACWSRMRKELRAAYRDLRERPHEPQRGETMYRRSMVSWKYFGMLASAFTIFMALFLGFELYRLLTNQNSLLDLAQLGELRATVAAEQAGLDVPALGSPSGVKVMLVILDGLRTDYLDSNPNFSALLADESIKNDLLRVPMTVQLPSMSVPNWLTFITGSPPWMTGVIGNAAAQLSAFDSVFSLAFAGNLSTGLTASSWFADLIQDYIDPGDEMINDAEYNYQRGLPNSQFADSQRKKAVERVVKGLANYSFYLAHFSDIDERGHYSGVTPRYNPGDTYNLAVSDKAAALRNILENIDSETVAIVVSDHGHVGQELVANLRLPMPANSIGRIRPELSMLISPVITSTATKQWEAQQRGLRLAFDRMLNSDLSSPTNEETSAVNFTNAVAGAYARTVTPDLFLSFVYCIMIVTLMSIVVSRTTCIETPLSMAARAFRKGRCWLVRRHGNGMMRVPNPGSETAGGLGSSQEMNGQDVRAFAISIGCVAVYYFLALAIFIIAWRIKGKFYWDSTLIHHPDQIIPMCIITFVPGSFIAYVSDRLITWFCRHENADSVDPPNDNASFRAESSSISASGALGLSRTLSSKGSMNERSREALMTPLRTLKRVAFFQILPQATHQGNLELATKIHLYSFLVYSLILLINLAMAPAFSGIVRYQGLVSYIDQSTWDLRFRAL